MVQRITLIGTGHVMQYHQRLMQAIAALDPDAIAVELDGQRLKGLLEHRAGKREKAANPLLRFLQRYQQRQADRMGGQIGEDMLAGYESARLLGRPLLLIDRPLGQTMARFKSELSTLDKAKLVGSLVGDLITGFFRPGKEEEQIQKLLAGDPSVMAEVEERFPKLARILISERDEWMVKQLQQAPFHHVVAIVGDGHVPGMERLIGSLRPTDESAQPLQLTVYRIHDVESDRLPKPAFSDYSVAYEAPED